MNEVFKFKKGDTVLHRPSGETWMLIEDEKDGRVFPGGWPPSMAWATDCILEMPTESHSEWTNDQWAQYGRAVSSAMRYARHHVTLDAARASGLL